MAEVYLGADQILGRRVAVKVLGSQYARDASFVTRFRREAQAAAALSHPNVVGVFDTGSDDGTHFIVMEYIQGKTLALVIREDGPLLPERAVEIADAVAAGLAFAHRAGIVHRDIKPGNIMITPGGEVKVMDFGIARATAGESLTQTATVLGTATYFSPEQAQGDSVDARSDIYSLGCVLYEMLTAHPPFAGDTAVAVAFKHVKEDPVAPSRLNHDVPQELDAVVMKCLAKNPANRYQTADELRADLERFRTGRGVLATPLLPLDATQVVEREARPTTVLPATAVTAQQRRRRRWVAGAILLVVLVALAAGLFALAGNLLSNNQPTTVAVPCLVGRPQGTELDALAKAGLTPSISKANDDHVRAGNVISCQPTGQQTKGTSITVNVSLGPAKKPVQVPDVICLPKDAAVAELTGLHLNHQFGAPVANPACPAQKDLVARQSPAGGSTATEGDTVILNLNPQPTTPPP